MFWRAIIMNRLHYRQAQGHIFASTPMLRSAFVKKSPLQKQLLMMQFEKIRVGKAQNYCTGISPILHSPI